MSKRILLVVLWSLVAAALLVVVGLWMWKSTPATPPRGGTGQSVEIANFGAPFSLVDHNGDAITQAAIAGRPSLVFFGFTHCPEVCPTTLFDVNRWMDAADPDQDELQAFFVTVDPERDTPELMASYVTAFSERITGITGPVDDVLAMADAWKVFYEKQPYSDDPADGYNMNHTASVFLIDAQGSFRGTISYGAPDQLAVEKLQVLM